jgi:predicted GIY-YIG superfamily endonuclease
MSVYLLHFSTKLHHAQHYIGSTRDLESRLAQHRNGTGARLLEVINTAGISWQVARTWDGGWGLERYLKRQKNGPRLCPICTQQRAYKAIYRGGNA